MVKLATSHPLMAGAVSQIPFLPPSKLPTDPTTENSPVLQKEQPSTFAARFPLQDLYPDLKPESEMLDAIGLDQQPDQPVDEESQCSVDDAGPNPSESYQSLSEEQFGRETVECGAITQTSCANDNAWVGHRA